MIANGIRLLVGLASTGLMAFSLGIVPSASGLTSMSLNDETTSSKAANAGMFSSEHLDASNGVAASGANTQVAFYQAQGSLSDALPPLPGGLPGTGGGISDSSASLSDVGLPDLPSNPMRSEGNVMPPALVSPPVGQPAAPPPLNAGGSSLNDSAMTGPNRSSIIPADDRGPLPQSLPPSGPMGSSGSGNAINSDNGARGGAASGALVGPSVTPSGANIPPAAGRSRSSGNPFPNDANLPPSLPPAQPQISSRGPAAANSQVLPRGSAGVDSPYRPSSNWARAQRELSAGPQQSFQSQPNPQSQLGLQQPSVEGDRRVRGQPVAFPQNAGENELRAIDNLRQINEPQANSNGRLNPNSIATGLPYVTPRPTGRYPTSPYNYAVFQNAAYHREVAQAGPTGPGQLASSQVASGQLAPVGQPTIAPGGAIANPYLYLTSAVTCNPQVLPQQMVVPQQPAAVLPQPSLPPPGQVPGVYTPPTLTPNLTPGIYSPNNSGYTPLFSLGQEGYNVQLGRGLVGQPTVYVPGQPVRNFLRYLSP